MSLENIENAFVKSRNDGVKNKRQMQKHTRFVQTASELTTQQACAGISQTRQKT